MEHLVPEMELRQVASDEARDSPQAAIKDRCRYNCGGATDKYRQRLRCRNHLARLVWFSTVLQVHNFLQFVASL
jgi:hypothetical protein